MAVTFKITKNDYMGTVVMEKLKVSHLVKKLAVFYGFRRFPATFAKAHHLALS